MAPVRRLRLFICTGNISHTKNAPANLTTVLTDIARFFRRQDDFCDYGLVAPHLMPVMRDYAENYLDWCHLKREYGDAVGNYQALLWCEHLVIFPVIDTGESQVRVTSRMLEDWSQDFDTVIEQAANNLIAKTEHFDFASIYDNETGTDCCHESTWNDHYDAMRLCYFSFPDLSVSGKRLYLLVNPSKLFIWGAGDVLGTACALQKLDEMSGANSVVRKLPPYVLCDALVVALRFINLIQREKKLCVQPWLATNCSISLRVTPGSWSFYLRMPMSCKMICLFLNLWHYKPKMAPLEVPVPGRKP
ncbi:MAG: hypothetical protein IPL73_22610 [Candidatus Obscuribacter sp.]|nr:hypothetical protein [Candidatus Obscuribacter sp.]